MYRTQDDTPRGVHKKPTTDNTGWGVFTSGDLYAAPQDVDLCHAARRALKSLLAALRGLFYAGYEFPRIYLLRT
jgi:hypothetical protein